MAHAQLSQIKHDIVHALQRQYFTTENRSALKVHVFLLFDHPVDLFVCKSCLHLSVLLLGGLYTNLEEF